MIRVFIGYDPRQPLAFNVAAQSVSNRASIPTAVTKLKLSQLAPFDRRGLTEFTYSRFLVPYLCGYQGYGLFLDADVLCLGDVAELFDMAAKSDHAVYVSKNKLRYEWASVMLFNNEKCMALTPDAVSERDDLHVIGWTDDIGELPPEWNHLVGYDEPREDAKLVHYTQGVPCWPETENCEYSDEWKKEFMLMCATVSFKELMGNSVHAKHVYKRLKDAGHEAA